MPTRSKVSDLRYAHEDEMQDLFPNAVTKGKTPLYVYRSADDEAYFVSSTPITKKRIREEFAGHALCIVGFDEDF